jgi:hypothetical protein
MHFQSFFVPLLTAQADEVAVVGPVEEFAALDRAPAGEEVALVVAVSLSHGYSHRPGGGDIALWGNVAGKPPLTGEWPHPSARGSAAAPAHAMRCRQRCTDRLPADSIYRGKRWCNRRTMAEQRPGQAGCVTVGAAPGRRLDGTDPVPTSNKDPTSSNGNYAKYRTILADPIRNT